MSSSLNNFREFASLLFRVVANPSPLAGANYHHDCVDRLLSKYAQLLQERDNLIENNNIPIRHRHDEFDMNRIAEAFYAHEQIRPPTPPTLVIHSDQRAEEIVPNVVVTKDEPETKTVTVKNTVVIRPAPAYAEPVPTPVVQPPMPDAEDGEATDDDNEIVKDLNLGDGDDIEEEDEEVEAEEMTEPEAEAEEAEEEAEEAEEEAEEAEEEAEAEEVEEEAEEEEEAMEIIKIKKKKFFCGEHSKKVYEYIDDESAGDCLGTLVDGRIVPLE